MELPGNGFTVTILENGRRAGLTYREGTRSMHISGELLAAGPFDFAVVARTVSKWDGFDAPVDDAERERIIANIVAAGLAHGWRFEIER